MRVTFKTEKQYDVGESHKTTVKAGTGATVRKRDAEFWHVRLDTPDGYHLEYNFGDLSVPVGEVASTFGRNLCQVGVPRSSLLHIDLPYGEHREHVGEMTAKVAKVMAGDDGYVIVLELHDLEVPPGASIRKPGRLGPRGRLRALKPGVLLCYREAKLPGGDQVYEYVPDADWRDNGYVFNPTEDPGDGSEVVHTLIVPELAGHCIPFVLFEERLDERRRASELNEFRMTYALHPSTNDMTVWVWGEEGVHDPVYIFVNSIDFAPQDAMFVARDHAWRAIWNVFECTRLTSDGRPCSVLRVWDSAECEWVTAD